MTDFEIGERLSKVWPLYEITFNESVRPGFGNFPEDSAELLAALEKCLVEGKKYVPPEPPEPGILY